MKLNETGVNDEIVCPYCGYPEANDQYESGGITYRGKNFQYFKYCPICGWTQYGGDDDEEGEYNIPPKANKLIEAQKIVAIYKKLVSKKDMATAVYYYTTDMEPKNLQEFMTGLIAYCFEEDY